MEANNELIMMEMRLLENNVVKKIYMKRFLNYQILFKNKQKRNTKRRKYISLSREFLNSMDSHVEKCIDMKPSIAYNLFEKLESNKIKQENNCY